VKETLVTEAQAKIPNIYTLINVAACRTEQVMQGAVPSVLLEGASAIEVALQEITEGKIEPSEDGRLWTVVG
jgi:DNA-directed RNA polymerase subunit K/omega